MTHATTDPQGKSPDQIEAEIAAERGRIVETVEELQRRVAPGEAMSRAVDSLTREGEALFDVVADKVRRNPVPAAMIGLGVAWLLFGGDRRDDWSGEGRTYEREPRYGYGRASAFGDQPYRGRGGDGEGGVADKVGELQRGAQRRLGAAAESAGEAYEDVRHRVRDVGSRAGEMTREGMQRARSAMQDNPLLAGAVAFVAGAALGGAVPNTRSEDELMGEQAEHVRELAARKAREAQETAQRAGEAALDEAGRIASESTDKGDERHGSGDDIERRTREAVGRVAEAARTESGSSTQSRTTTGL